MTIYFFNTLTRKVEPFISQDKKKVKLYSCGPTVYNYAHIGNLRTYVFEDVLRRFLEYMGFDVLHILNITDVGHLTSDSDTGEDKMEKGAKREGKTVYEIAKYYEDRFFYDCKRLNILYPKIKCKATEHIKEQIDLIKKLQENGYTYKTNDGIYFDSSKFKNYGKLAKINIKNLKEGARVKINIEKKNKHDFALWKFSDEKQKRQMQWNSPFGLGFPGWHIECSAMALKYAGPTLDIHCGGIDHIPIHHTNEIAQSECATNNKFSNYWLHCEFLIMDKENKMSKSKDNFLTLDKVLEMGFKEQTIRFFLLNAHYRQKLKFSKKTLSSFENKLNNLQRTIDNLINKKSFSLNLKNQNLIDEMKKCEEGFFSSLKNDLNMPQALTHLSKLQNIVNKKIDDFTKNETKTAINIFKNINKILAIFIFKNEKIPKKIKEILKKRELARKNKDFKTSDKLRDELKQAGYIVQDKLDKQILLIR